MCSLFRVDATEVCQCFFCDQGKQTAAAFHKKTRGLVHCGDAMIGRGPAQMTCSESAVPLKISVVFRLLREFEVD